VPISADGVNASMDTGRPELVAGRSAVPAARPESPDGGSHVAAPASGGSSVAAIRGVLRVTPFRRLWYATALSSLGDWLGLLATTAMAASLAHGYKAQNYALGGVLVIRLLPAVVLGPVAGAFADRFDRRRTMVIGDFARFALFVTIPIAHLVVSEHKTLIWLYIASFLIECVSLFWLPAKDASVPNLVRRDQVESANQLSLITTYGLTPVLGAALFSVLSLITTSATARWRSADTSCLALSCDVNGVSMLAMCGWCASGASASLIAVRKAASSAVSVRLEKTSKRSVVGGPGCSWSWMSASAWLASVCTVSLSRR